METRNVSSEKPRILTWVKIVERLNNLLKQDLFWVGQASQTKNALCRAMEGLTGVYAQCWLGQDIGYPNTLEILKKWGKIPLEISDPVRYLRELELSIAAVELDILVERYHQDYIVKDNPTSEMILGPKDERTVGGAPS